MQTFNKGDRIKYVGTTPKRFECVGTVQDAYRDYDGERIVVLFDGDDKAWSYEDESFELAKETYIIENFGEDSTIAVMELDKKELALIEKLVEQLNDNRPLYAPDMTITKQVKK